MYDGRAVGEEGGDAFEESEDRIGEYGEEKQAEVQREGVDSEGVTIQNQGFVYLSTADRLLKEKSMINDLVTFLCTICYFYIVDSAS